MLWGRFLRGDDANAWPDDSRRRVNVKKKLRDLVRRIKALAMPRQERRQSLVGPAKLWRMKRDFQISFLKRENLKPAHYLLDIGCGTLRGGIPIIEYLDAGHYYGIESRKEVLDEGVRELREAGLEDKRPKLLDSEDNALLTIDRKFDFAWAFSVLIHMSDDILDRTLHMVSKHLSSSGVFYANVNIGERDDGYWQGFPVVWRSLDYYKGVCSSHGLRVEDVGSLHELGHISNIHSQDVQRMLRISRM